MAAWGEASEGKPRVASRKQDGHDEQDEQDEHDRQDDSRARSEASEGLLFKPHGLCLHYVPTKVLNKDFSRRQSRRGAASAA